MMQLVAPEKEPITPFLRLVRPLYNDLGISTILVVGGVGDYFDVAHNVVLMDCYQCHDATERAKQIVATSASQLPHSATVDAPLRSFEPRGLFGKAFVPNGKVKVNSQSTISYGETELDISGLEQLVSKAQTAAISSALQRISDIVQERQSIRQVLAALEQTMNAEGLDGLAPGQYHGGMARPRRLELAGAINRLRRTNSIVQTR